MIVPDTSVIAAAIHSDEATPEVRSVLAAIAADTALVPRLFWTELANVLRTSVRRGRMSTAQAVQAAALVDQLPLITSGCPDTALEALQASLQHNLTAYDATYLVMAMQGGFTLATLDRDLRRAAQEVGVKVLPDESGR